MPQRRKSVNDLAHVNRFALEKAVSAGGISITVSQ